MVYGIGKANADFGVFTDTFFEEFRETDVIQGKGWWPHICDVVAGGQPQGSQQITQYTDTYG